MGESAVNPLNKNWIHKKKKKQKNSNNKKSCFMRMQSRFVLMILSWSPKQNSLVKSKDTQKYESEAKRRGKILNKELSVRGG